MRCEERERIVRQIMKKHDVEIYDYFSFGSDGNVTLDGDFDAESLRCLAEICEVLSKGKQVFIDEDFDKKLEKAVVSLDLDDVQIDTIVTPPEKEPQRLHEDLYFGVDSPEKADDVVELEEELDKVL